MSGERIWWVAVAVIVGAFLALVGISGALPVGDLIGDLIESLAIFVVWAAILVAGVVVVVGTLLWAVRSIRKGTGGHS